MARVSKSEQAEAVERLRSWIKPGDTIYCILRSVSRSGMNRKISFVGFQPTETRQNDQNGVGVWDYSYNVALACGYPHDRDRSAVSVNGAGMDMGFAVVYDLGHVLFNDPTALQSRWL